jgi:hypothetical protein
MGTRVLYLLLLITLISCATFYEINYEFNQEFSNGQFEKAEKTLASSEKRMSRHARFLYLVNRGTVDFLQGEHQESNQFFEDAYLYSEDYQKNYLDIGASFLVNPNLIDYPGEDHEKLFILYYKALNYCQLQDYESALIECRRLNNRLYELSDKYNNENRYREDAFVHNLMGIIYQASGDYNNAFIAYENAYKIYKSSYSELFGLQAPEQLKLDLLHAAYLTGFYDKVEFYEKEFDLQYQKSDPPAGGEAMVFWHNGQAPVKDEWSVNFTITGGDDFVTFANDEYDLNFTFPYNLDDDADGAQLTDLRFFRIAFPKYVDRIPDFREGEIIVNGYNYSLEQAEDISAIAQKTLQQRMVAEMSKALMRAALKKLAEKQISEENEGLGLAMSVLNAATEKADTRNWQTLPNSIYYARVPLDTGTNEVILHLYNPSSRQEMKEIFVFNGNTGHTIFHTYQTLN